MPETGAAEWADVTVTEILRTDDADILQRKHVMMLHEQDGERSLPIWIGPAEATALALALESTESPRPATYQLAASLVQAAGSHLQEVRITRLTAGVFYASVIVQGPAGPQEVDARPSDAVNLALVTGAPIRIDSRLLDVEFPAAAAKKSAPFRVATAQMAAEARQRIEQVLITGRASQAAGGAEPAPGH